MSEPQPTLREYVGFVWWGPDEDWADFLAKEKTGVLVYAADVTEAAAIVRECYGHDVRMSIRNEEDARRPR